MKHCGRSALLVAGLLALTVAAQATDFKDEVKDFDSSLEAKMKAIVDDAIPKADDPDVPAFLRNKARAYPAIAKAAIALGKPDPRCPLLRGRGRTLLQAIERPGNCTSCCYCPPGYYYNGEDLVQCPADDYCSGGWFPYDDLQAGSEPVACPAPQTTCGQTGAQSPADCACNPCATPPTTPLNVSMSSYAPGKVAVQWSPPTNLGTPLPGTYSYSVTCQPASAAVASPCTNTTTPGVLTATVPVTQNAPAFLFANVTGGAKYKCYVGLSNAAAVCGGGSQCAAATCAGAFCSAGNSTLTVVKDCLTNANCTSPTGTCCSGSCVNLATDAVNCGSCAKACNASATPAETCQFGVCSSESLCIENIKGAASKTPGCGVCSSSCPSTTSCTTYFGSGTTTCDSKEGSVKGAVAGCTTGKCCLPTSSPVTKTASPTVLPTDGICVVSIPT